MKELISLELAEIQSLKQELEERYHRFQSANLNLDMTRGKPCPEQLDLASAMLDNVTASNHLGEGGDYRNYGGADGIPEAKRLFSEYMEVTPEELIIGGNSSLNLMYDAVADAMLRGVLGGSKPWSKYDKPTFLCPSPGYDRHFAVCEALGVSLIPVSMNNSGPDMDEVESLVASNDQIVGIWCVPKYSNPTGIVYSDEVVDRLAKMPVASKDFRIFWDNAYAEHHLTETPKPLKNILSACTAAGNPDRVYLFGSTSKISFAGAGISFIAGSKTNMDFFRKRIGFQTIGPDKINQLRHTRFFRDIDGLRKHMLRHAAILAPKFDATLETLKKELGGYGVAEWEKPEGGYFISINAPTGTATEIVKLAGAAGVKLTPAGATFPYGKDPEDRNIRIAPSFPSTEGISVAMELVSICILLAAISKLG